MNFIPHSPAGTEYKASDEWSSYRRLLTYVYPYRFRLFWGIVFGALFGGSTLGGLTALQSGMIGVFGGGGTETKLNVFIEDFLGRLLNGEPGTEAITIAILVALTFFVALRGIGFFLSKYFVEWVGHRVVTDLRDQVFSRILDLPMSFFTKSRTGELMSRTTSDTQLVERGVTTVIGDLVREPFVLIAALYKLVTLDYKLAFMSLVVFPVCILPVAIFGRRVRRFAREGQARLADLASIQQEAITGVRVVKAFGMEESEKGRFRARSASLFRRMVRIAVARAAVVPFIELISVLAVCLVLIYARRTGMTWDQLIVFLGALMLMYEPVKKISRLHLGIQHSAAAADRIFEIIDTESVIENAPDARPLDFDIKSVEFNDVSFAYDSEPVLKHIRLKAHAGECIAFVGSSGSGKTTLVSLIPRFFDPVAGQILINGIDLRTFDLKSLRKHIGLVTQETILFNDTVASNISYGTPGAAKEAIVEAARRAHAHDFIMSMPEGYDTVIGERGVRLSGGQCQRLSIARAMLRNPPILILDEATSALDTESERQVQAALDELMANRTVFAIAHRLSTIAHADRIVVLSQGSIVEEGSHRELLERDGLYKYLYDLQFDT